MPSRESISDILNDRSLETLRGITSAKAALVDPQGGAVVREITLYKNLSDDDAQLLICLLTDVESWSFCLKRCLPVPTALVNLSGQLGNATLSIGIRCQDWHLVIGSQRQTGFFDPVAADVRGILKRTFPQVASPNARSIWRSGVIGTLSQSEKPVDIDAIDFPQS